MKKDKDGKSALKMEKYNIKEKLLISTLISFAASFMVFIVNPIDIFANNAQEFSFALGDFILPLLLCFLVCFAAVFGFLIIFNKQLLNTFTSVILSIFASSYIYNLTIGKGTFVSGDVRIDLNKAQNAYFIILGITIYIMLLLGLFLKKQWKNICVFLCVLLIAMNSATLLTDFTAKNAAKANGAKVEYALTEKNMFNVSDKENVVYFLFDRFDKIFYDEVVEKYPDYFSKTLDGFTYFDNTVSTFSRTYPAVTGMITGVTYDGKTSADEYFKKAYTTSPFLKDLKNNGYNVNLYVDRYYEYSDAKYFKDIADNTVKVKGYTPNKKNILSYLLQLSGCRILPFSLSTTMFKFTVYGTVLKLSDLKTDGKIYHDDDAEVYKNLTASGLDTYDSDKNFTFIYLHGSHSPFTLNSNVERVGKSTSIEQTIGSFKIIDEYIKELKRLGVYDNTTIVITGDHGYPYTDTESLLKYMDKGTRTCVFIKPKNSKGELKTKHTQASLTDIIPTIVKDTKLKTNHNYGESLFDIDKNQTRTRIYYHSRLSGDSKLIFDKYKITGDAADKNNWKFEKSIDTKQAWY